MMCEPSRGWRHVKGSDRRTRRDDAGCVRDRVDVPSRRAAKIRLVQDNRNTHDGARLDEAFPPAEARRILDRIAFHTRPSTAVGCTWRRWRSASWTSSAWTAG
jgi:hypothetical protein